MGAGGDSGARGRRDAGPGGGPAEGGGGGPGLPRSKSESDFAEGVRRRLSQAREAPQVRPAGARPVLSLLRELGYACWWQTRHDLALYRGDFIKVMELKAEEGARRGGGEPLARQKPTMVTGTDC